MEEKALGKRLQAARQRAGLTQQQLCEQAGLAYSTLAKIERGAIASPSVFTVAAIATATNTPLVELLGDLAPTSAEAGPKHSKSGISFVYFDIGGTLVSSIQVIFSKIAKRTGLPVSTIEMFFWRQHDQVATGHQTMAEFNRAEANYLGLKHFDWDSYTVGANRKIPQAQNLLKWTADHYKVGLLTNNLPGAVDRYKSRHLLPDLDYTAIVDSSEVGFLKPDARIYEVAQAKANVPAGQILLVDNEQPNLIGAERAGWRAVHFDELKPTDSAKHIQKLLEF